jgi:DNA polymerase IV
VTGTTGIPGDATILHADLDSFYASVEQRDDPRLRDRPMFVGTGVVLAASYEAKAHGVRTAMNAAQARRLCPQALVVPPRMDAYAEASKAVFEVFEQITPLVEALSIDEAFLEVGGLHRTEGVTGSSPASGTPADIARRLRSDVKEQVGLPISVGVARTKFLAKVASASAKPDGLLIVPPEEELTFLHALPVERLWGVGPVTMAKLHSRAVVTVADVAALPEAALVSMLGKASGRHLHALAHNRDPRPVQARARRKSIGAQHALGRSAGRAGQVDLAAVDAILSGLVDKVARRLRDAERSARTVTLHLRFEDFTRASRSHTLPDATAGTTTLLSTARWLLDEATPTVQERGISLIGIAAANLEDAGGTQLALPLATGEAPTGATGTAGAALDAALDEVRERFGSAAVTRAALLNHDRRPDAPLLPD